MDQKISISYSQLHFLNSRRKRKINLHITKNEVRKKNKNSAQPFISSVGVPIPGKLPSEGKICSIRCEKRGCLLSVHAKEEIFQMYYSSGNYDLQTTFLLSCISRENVEEQANRVNNKFRYFLPQEGEKYEVCQLSFKDILKISEKRVRVIQEKLLQGKFIGKDLRGKHTNRHNKLDGFVLDLIRTHIQSFPTELSHYKRNAGDPLREYLPPGLNASKMYRLFKEANEDYIRAPFLKDAYFKQLKTSGLRFAKLRSDTCSICDKLHIAEKNAQNAQERQNIRIEVETHHELANSGYTRMREDCDVAKADPTVVVLCVDLEQVLFSPTLVHKDMFYMRQFSSYNYCIYNVGVDDAVMCFWTEVMATRGSEEMLSCLWRYISTNFQPLEENATRALILWSDRCTGQNNNYISLAFGKLLIKRQYFTVVEQKFLCSGHSFLVCDRLFGLIEKQKKISKVYSPEEWLYVFEQARPTKPFRNQVMSREHFLAFDDLLDIVPKPPSLKVTQALWFRMTQNDMAGILTKTQHTDLEDFVRHEIKHPFCTGIQHGQRASWTDDWLEYLGFRIRNDTEIPIDAKKYADLMKMMDYLDPQYREYYVNLPHL